MARSSNHDEWQRKATNVAIAEARKIVASSGPLMNTPVGRLNDTQWGFIFAGALFGWIQTRCQQEIAEGLDQEDAVRLTGHTPSPAEVATVRSILPALADQASIDWSEPLATWSQDRMTGFLVLAWQLLGKAELAGDQGAGGILRKPTTFDEKVGDPIPF
jgi:hypothetical protein